MPKVIVDGIETRVATDARLLTAIRKAGVWLPTLCYSPAVSARGACRICLVEVDVGGRTKTVTACNYPVRDDVEVTVNGGKAERLRRGVMELLLARSPESPELRELATRMGVDATPYPTVTESQRNCILCGLCVRVCEEAVGATAISFSGRGVDRSVSGPFRLAAEDCIACGACAYICPVGTIQLRYHEDALEISPFKAKVPYRTCSGCGAKIVPEKVADAAKQRFTHTLRENLGRLDLCPACRRKEAVKSLGFVTEKIQASPAGVPAGDKK
jgi:bidirectional [NiFe] hydrogenase diaphorase subunit